MFAVIVALNLIGWAILVFIVEPDHYRVGGTAFGIGIGLTAYALGAKHAFDVDHIAAIDNVTRKLMNDGQRPLAVGFFFALGHSTVVLVLAVLLVIGMTVIVGPLQQGSSALHHYTGLIGTGVSGVFLCLIAAVNVAVLAGTGAAVGLPAYAVLCLPVLFAAGMCLLDTLDGSFMNFAYGWAYLGRRRAARRRPGNSADPRRAAALRGRILGMDPRRELRQARPRHRRPVRLDLGGRAAGVALRSHRREMDRAAATRRLNREVCSAADPPDAFAWSSTGVQPRRLHQRRE